jgi:hypothetical protein
LKLILKRFLTIKNQEKLLGCLNDSNVQLPLFWRQKKEEWHVDTSRLAFTQKNLEHILLDDWILIHKK